MKKMAVFVEGETELRFIDRLLREIANEKNLQIVLVRASGGARSARTYKVVGDSGSGNDKDFYIRIINSGTDNRVGSDIRDNYEALMNASFSVIIGVRDVYPDFLLADLPRLRDGLRRYQPNSESISVDFVLGVMEIEAWFLAEHTHFPRIHPNLSVSRIAELYGFDPSIEDMQLRTNPALDLHNAYSLEGFAYKKTGSQIQRTVNALDYAAMYLEHKAKFPDFAVLMRVIDQFFS
jgi:hypothetical protein